MSEELAAYIADYVNEEYQSKYHNFQRGTFPRITTEMILKAIEAYKGELRDE